jgi:flagellar biosynthesis protein FlhB
MDSRSKNLPPTSRKLKKSREEGDVAKSKDFSGAILVLTGLASSLAGVRLITCLVSHYWEKSFGPDRDFQTNNMLLYVVELGNGLWKPVITLFLAVFIAAFLAEVVQVGFTFSLKSLAFKLSRLSIAQGFCRILGFREGITEQGVPLGLVKEISKTVMFFSALAGTAIVLSFHIWPTVLFADYDNAGQLLDSGWCVVSRVACGVGGAYLLLGLADLLLERRARCLRLRMDIEELKQEMRESEGDPETKLMRRQMFQELACQGVIQGIRRAKVLVVGGDRG